MERSLAMVSLLLSMMVSSKNLRAPISMMKNMVLVSAFESYNLFFLGTDTYHYSDKKLTFTGEYLNDVMHGKMTYKKTFL